MKAITLVALLAAFAVPAVVLGQSPAEAPSSSAASAPIASETDILNFALQLEYLEGEFYSCAATGSPLPDDVRGGGPPSTGCEKAQLGAAAQGYASELASDELAHVRLLRAALGEQATPIPQIDIGSAFAAAANAAFQSQGVTPLSPAFSPYLNDVFFYLGAFIFEDVGVTAYSGAAASLASNPQVLSTAAQILSVESYHAGLIRTLLAQQREGETPYNVTVGDVANAIGELRDTLGGGEGKEVPLVEDNEQANVVPADSQGLTFQRSPTEVLGIVTAGGGANGGGFFPSGINGNLGGSASS